VDSSEGKAGGYMEEDWALGPALHPQSGNMAKNWPAIAMVKKSLLGTKPVTPCRVPAAGGQGCSRAEGQPQPVTGAHASASKTVGPAR